MKFLAFLISAVILISCGTETKNEINSISELSKPLSKLQPVLVEIPEDGTYKQKIYIGTGRKISEILKEQFEKYARSVQIVSCGSSNCKNIDGYLVSTKILNWEDRATGISGRRDRVAFTIKIVELRSNTILTSSVIQSTGGNSSMAQAHVEDLLPKIISDYVSALY